MIITVLCPMTNFNGVYAATATTDTQTRQIQMVMDETAKLLVDTVKDPVISQVGGEWTILGLARSGYSVPAGYYDQYARNVEKELAEKSGVLTSVKYTEYSRLILAMTAIARDVDSVGGYNLLEKLSDFDNVKKQGVNGPAFALLALDSHGYEIPAAAASRTIANGGTVTSREGLIEYLLNKGPVAGDADRTGIMLQALAKYKDRKEVKAFSEKAFQMIDGLENSDGSFPYGGVAASESIAQVIVAKAMWGIDCRENVDALLTYHMNGGGFEHVRGQGFDLMATEQALYALTAYERSIAGKTALYDMTDVVIFSPAEIRVSLNGNYIAFDQPPVIENSRTLVPMRAIFEVFGAVVTWDQETKTVTGTLDGKVVTLTVGDKTSYVNGEAATLDVPAKIINGRTMVPVRFISESLDADVQWIQSPMTVVITK